MTIRRRIYIAGAVIFVILIVLALMNVGMLLEVRNSLKTLDAVNQRLAASQEYETWATDLSLQVSDMVAAGRVPRKPDQGLSPPRGGGDDESRLLASQADELIRLVDEKQTLVRKTQDRLDQLRLTVSDLYYQLDTKIATVLAVAQMDRVMGRERSQQSDLAPYVLKSLNQLTLIALDSLLTREVSRSDIDIVNRNRRFLATQLPVIDADGTMAELFDQLLAQIDTLAQLLPRLERAAQDLDTRIAAAKQQFDQVMDSTKHQQLVMEAASDVRVANEALETTSRLTLAVAILSLIAMPLLVVLTGVLGLNRLVLRPITNLAGAMKDVERGNFDIEAPVRQSDEIGKLAEAFNTMARQIKATVDDLARLNQTLERSEEQLKTILESSANPIVVYDSNGTAQYLNPAFTEVFGWTLDSLHDGQAGYIPEDQRELSAARAAEVRTTGRAVRYSSKRLTRDGQALDVIISAALVRSANGTGMVENLTDISELNRLEIRLRQAQKMEAVGRLAGGVAHDFNNMLTIILGNAQMVLKEEVVSPTIRLSLQEIDAAARRSTDLTRQLLAFARKQTVSPKVLDLNTTIENMLRMLRRLIGEDIELAWRPGEDIWPVKMDPSQIDQVLANLCVNACDAIDGVGRITIETANVEFDEFRSGDSDSVQPGSYVQLAISDNGSGMDADTLANVFEPFFTTKSEGKGTGLGLATVYGIVKQNDGFIRVYSEPEHGTTFRIYLPRQGGPEAASKALEDQQSLPTGTETILLVEDEPAILALGRAMLESLGYDVLTAVRPRDALDLPKAKLTTVNALITDVVMPEMNGRDLAARLVQEHPALKCLFMSGYTADVIAHHGVLDKGVHFVQKPFSRQDLAMKVREAIDGV